METERRHPLRQPIVRMNERVIHSGQLHIFQRKNVRENVRENITYFYNILRPEHRPVACHFSNFFAVFLSMTKQSPLPLLFCFVMEKVRKKLENCPATARAQVVIYLKVCSSSLNIFPSIFHLKIVKLSAVLGFGTSKLSLPAAGPKYRRELENGRSSEDRIETGKDGPSR